MGAMIGAFHSQSAEVLPTPSITQITMFPGEISPDRGHGSRGSLKTGDLVGMNTTDAECSDTLSSLSTRHLIFNSIDCLENTPLIPSLDMKGSLRLCGKNVRSL
jgi:hypothetical protein